MRSGARSAKIKHDSLLSLLITWISRAVPPRGITHPVPTRGYYIALETMLSVEVMASWMLRSVPTMTMAMSAIDRKSVV